MVKYRVGISIKGTKGTFIGNPIFKSPSHALRVIRSAKGKKWLKENRVTKLGIITSN